jgi:predicted Ser/Thr protein kinase
MAIDFEKLTDSLVQRGISLEALLQHLESRYASSASSSTTLSRSKQALKHLGMALLQDSKISLEELNPLLKTLTPSQQTPRGLLQELLKKRKILVEDFLQWDQKSWELETRSAPYELRESPSQELEFFLTSSENSPFYGNYKVLEELARGGMGIIYKAYHAGLNQTFALKVMIAGENASENALKRFQREIQISAKLDHPFLVKTLDTGQKGNEYYFVMEYVEGGSLQEWLRGNFPLRQGLKFIQQSLEALDYAHHQGVLHRDLKPANLLISTAGIPKITDFGLAKEIEEEADKRLTRTGTLLGTPAYMAPEQLQGDPSQVNASTDIYGMGVCLYEVLTRTRPFHATQLNDLIQQILKTPPQPPSKKNPVLHRDLDTIVLKALEKSKKDRYRSALDFAQDIERFLEGYPILARPTTLSDKLFKWFQRNRKLSLFVGGTLFLLGAFSTYTYLSLQQLQQKKIQNLCLKVRKIRTLAQNPPAYTDLEERYKKKIFFENPLLEKIPQWLELLEEVNQELFFHPQNQALEQEKLALTRLLITSACESKDYHLAEYLVSDLTFLSCLSDSEREGLSAEVQKEKNKQNRAYQLQFEEWKSALKQLHVLPRLKENMVFEISKMGESPFIFEELLTIFKEGSLYFLQKENRSSRKDEYYFTMLSALGRLENPKAIPFLIQTFWEMAQHYQPLEEIKFAELEFMVSLAEALSNIKQKSLILFFKEVQEKIPNSSILWSRIEVFYHTLLKELKEDS